MDWQIDLAGESMDIAAVADLTKAPSFNDITIGKTGEGKDYIGGLRFADCADAVAALARANEVLGLMNGLAAIEYANHKAVKVASTASLLHPDGRTDKTFVLASTQIRARAHCVAVGVGVRADGSHEPAPQIDCATARVERIAADPQLREIASIFSEPPTWQRLRVAYEKLTALIGNSGKHSQAVWQKGYATRGEVDNFEANVEDPRHSGIDAVHGVPDGELKGTKMTVAEGSSFIVRLFNTFIDRTS